MHVSEPRMRRESSLVYIYMPITWGKIGSMVPLGPPVGGGCEDGARPVGVETPRSPQGPWALVIGKGPCINIYVYMKREKEREGDGESERERARAPL